MPALRQWTASQWIVSHLVERLLDLPDPITRDITVHRDLRVPMPDGVHLLADHYTPASEGSTAQSPPTVLVRCPYGRRGAFGLLYGRPLAERGFQVLLQSVRGTFGSGGRFEPYRYERDDGLATVRWIRKQPWFSGQLATTGISYLGYTQWAIADDAGIEALCLQATASDFSQRTYDGGSFSFRTALSWTRTLLTQETRRRMPFRTDRELEEGLEHLPLGEADRVATGRTVGWFQDWLATGPSSPNWRSVSHTNRIPKISGPVAMRAGWYDIFLPWQLRDYALLVAAGQQPRLTIGAWGHSSLGMIRGIGRDTAEFLGETLLGQPPRPGGPVRYFVTGCDQWRDTTTWPPPGVQSQDWSLRPGGALRPDGELRPSGGLRPDDGSVPAGSVHAEHVDAGCSRFEYNPADPTPAVAGPRLDGRDSVRDNRELEARSDVLIFTSSPLATPLEVTGTPIARISVSADNPWHDLFVRLCDVHPDGASYNVGDRLIRLDPGTELPEGFTIEQTGDDVTLAVLELWPMAHRFAAGHRIRVQISGGAHPRFARNPGTGEPMATARRLVPSVISVHHDAKHRSAVSLPVTPLVRS